MRNKPLPCPFCGLPSKIRKEKSFFNNNQIMYKIECGAVGSECEIKPSTDLYKRKENAIEHWNIRSTK